MLKGLKKVHFIGIGGYGMSALAFILLQAGIEVRGSDIQRSGITMQLEKMGAKVFLGHQPEQVGDAQLAVYSTAIRSDNPEMEAARRKGLPLWHRSELLGAILNAGYGVAVAGTHGKTTTTAMISFILAWGGYDPTAVIGGEVPFFQGNARLGKSRYIIAEACESDHSFLRYKPRLALVTNIEADHLEHYNGSFEQLVETYLQFVDNARAGEKIILCGDDPVLQALLSGKDSLLMSYGLRPGADIRGGGVRLQGLGAKFKVYSQEKLLGEVTLKVPGRYNVVNALGAISVALYLGLDFATIKEALANFDGVKRRFEIVGEKEGVLVVDDYAHHPTEVKAALEAARQSGRRLVCVFQPHRYTRTSFLWDDFKKAFDEADLLLLTDIYSAGEKPLLQITASRLAREIQQRGHQGVHFLGDKEQVIAFLRKNTKSGDLVLTLGAGDVWQIGRDFLKDSFPRTVYSS
ncbi:MAG: UDP-N-acetylmuramate--L-alanine ligase [Dethiobacteria bacterium]